MAEQPKEPDPQKADGAKDEAAKPPESPWTALLKTLGEKALTALFTLGGLAAFAAFAGSIVLWTRFDALQLPPDQIVDVVPRAEAVTAGTTILLLFGFCGALAALAVFLIDRGGRATPGMSRGVLLIVAVEAVAAIWLAGDTATLDRLIATEALLLAFGGILWATYVGGLVELKEDGVPDLVDGEPHQTIEPSAFRNVHGRSQVGWPAVLIALATAFVAGGVAWTIAKLAGHSAAAAWAWALVVVGLALLLAVAAQWIVFQRCRKKERDDARKAAEDKRADEKKKRDDEDEKRKIAAAKARKLAKVVWLFSWLKAAMQQEKGKEKPSFSISLGAPEASFPQPEEEPEKKPEDPPKGKPPGTRLTPWGAAVVVPLALAAVIAPAVILGERWLVITLATIVVIGLGLWRIAELLKDRFIWYGLAVLLSVPFFGTVALATRNIDDPQAQPVAIIRGGDGPAEALQGLYVTETSDRVYFANVATQGCEKKIVPDSGRLFWVPKSEVVAMAIGPPQDVDTAARASLEMANALTPDIETSEGGHVSMVTEGSGATDSEASTDSGSEATTDSEQASTDGEASTGDSSDKGDSSEGMDGEEAETLGKRLESAGPAIRPKFGRGLRLRPEVASPGDTVELRIASPEFGGFGNLPDGSTLRLNGVKLPIVDREAAGGEGEGRPAEERIEFKVPPKATSGVVTVECTQLAGQPFLTVPQKPTARVTMRMSSGSRQVTFDSSRSSGVDGGSKGLVRRWTVAGLHMGQKVSVTADLPPRLAPYRVRLEIVDAEGRTDHVDLQVLRLPQSRFPFGKAQPHDTRPMRRVRRALRKAVEASPPAAIEIDGHADEVDTDKFNLDLSLRRARWMRRQTFVLHRDAGTAPTGADDPLVNSGHPVPLTVRAFGESCPIVHKPGPQAVNRRVEVFLLDPGASVAAAKGCRPARIRRMSW